MQEYYWKTMEKDLQQIVDMLLLNGTLTECPGLVNGKVGIAIFFFHYAQFTKNDLYADYAMDLIAETVDQLSVNSPADYEKGVAGIGVGIEYMICKSFLSVEDDICEDFDQRMIRAVMYDHLVNFSLYEGLIGYGRYWLARLNYKSSMDLAKKCLIRITTLLNDNLQNISVSEQIDVFCFLYDLYRISGFDNCKILLNNCCKRWNLESSDIIQCYPQLRESVVADVVSIYHCNKYFNNYLQGGIDIVLKQLPNLDMEKAPNSTGLLNGYAGEGMLRLTALKQVNMSWMNLL